MNKQFIGAGYTGGSRTVIQFCEANGISHTLFYELLKKGKGPRIIKAGRKTLIGYEAEIDWRATMEADAAAQNTQGA